MRNCGMERIYKMRWDIRVEVVFRRNHKRDRAMKTFLMHICIHVHFYRNHDCHRSGSLGSRLWEGHMHTVGFLGSAHGIATHVRDKMEAGLDSGVKWAEMLNKGLGWSHGELRSQDGSWQVSQNGMRGQHTCCISSHWRMWVPWLRWGS